MSHLNYVLSVWGPSLNADMVSPLCHVHNQAVWVTCGLRKYDHFSDCRLGLQYVATPGSACWFSTVFEHHAQTLYRWSLYFAWPTYYIGHQHSYTVAILHRLHSILLISCGVICLLQRNFHLLVTFRWNNLPNFYDTPLFSWKAIQLFLSVTRLLYCNFNLPVLIIYVVLQTQILLGIHKLVGNHP